MKSTNNPKVFNQKLKQYSLLAGTIAVAAPAANATVQYTANPDTTIGVGDVYALDLNNDGVDDFGFGITTNTGSGTVVIVPGLLTTNTNYVNTVAAVSAFNSNDIKSVATTFLLGSFNVPVVHSYSALISNSSTWITGGSSVLQGGLAAYSVKVGSLGTITSSGLPWLGTADKYMGVKLTVSGDVFYGWIRISVAADAKTITIKDYAYEDVIGDPINSGFTVGVDQREEEKTSIYSFGKEVRVKSCNSRGGVAVVYDPLGKEVQRTGFKGRDTRFNVKGAKGIYLIKVTSGDQTSTQKVYIE